MNDFTKDELIAIRDNLSAAYTPKENSILYGIYEKLQSMIENYCEHEYLDAMSCGGEHYYQCIKCRYLIGHPETIDHIREIRKK